jgi:hypothetical protein
MRAVVNCREWKIEFELIIIKNWKSPTNLITNPNPTSTFTLATRRGYIYIFIYMKTRVTACYRVWFIDKSNIFFLCWWRTVQDTGSIFQHIYTYIYIYIYIYIYRSRKPRIWLGDPSRWSRGTLFPQKLSPTSPTSGDSSVGMIRLRIQATEFYNIYMCLCVCMCTSC